VPRGWHYQSDGSFQSDQAGVTESLTTILARAGSQEPVLFTAAARDTGRRMGIERDRDSLLDYDEIRDLSPGLPGVQNPFRPDNPDSTGNNRSLEPDGITDSANDFDGDGVTNLAEFNAGTNPADNWPVAANLQLTITRSSPFTSVTLTWTAEPHGTYEIRWSHDLVAWTPLATGTVSAGAAGGPLTWTDNGPPDTPAPPTATLRRFYSVERIR
jgi:hypothetical protein